HAHISADLDHSVIMFVHILLQPAEDRLLIIKPPAEQHGPIKFTDVRRQQDLGPRADDHRSRPKSNLPPIDPTFRQEIGYAGAEWRASKVATNARDQSKVERGEPNRSCHLPMPAVGN